MNETLISAQNLAPVGVTSTQPTQEPSKPKVSESDHAMYQGMIALLNSIERTEEVSASLADMSKTMYDTVIKNGINKIQELQDNLEVLGYMLEHWDDLKDWQKQVNELKKSIDDLERMPPGFRPDDLIRELKEKLEELESNPPYETDLDSEKHPYILEMLNKYSRKSGARSYTNGVMQQLSTENQSVTGNKKLPDGLQAQVKSLVLQQGIFAAQMTAFIRIVQRQLQN